MTYLGGVFFLGQSACRGSGRAFSLVNPIVYMVSAFRYGLLGVSDIPLWIAYAIVIGFGAVLFGHLPDPVEAWCRTENLIHSAAGIHQSRHKHHQYQQDSPGRLG